MTPLWNRSVAVSFGPRGRENQGVKVEGLRISFEVTKTRESTPNTAKISIYNLSPKHRAMLETEEDLGVILEAGYGGNLEELFAGDIKRAVTQQQTVSRLESLVITTVNQGPDKVTTIEAASGQIATERLTFDKSYIEGQSTVNVLSDVIKSFGSLGIDIQNALSFLKSGQVSDKIAQAGMALSGMAVNHMDKLTGALGLEWSIQNNSLQLIPQNGQTIEEAVLLTPQTGLIGSPLWKKGGIEFTAMINPKIIPGRMVTITIEEKQYTGFFRVWRADFSGDTHDQNWYVKAEAKE